MNEIKSKIKYEPIDLPKMCISSMPSIENTRIVDATISSDAHFLYDKLRVTIEADVSRLAFNNEVLSGIVHRLKDFLNRGHLSRTPFLDVLKVVYHCPATIVYWGDGSRTVVKTQNDEPFDPEKGFAMACLKHLFDNKGNYYDFIKKWTSEENTEVKFK